MGMFKHIKVGVKLRTMRKMANDTKLHFRRGFQVGGYQTDDSKNGWAKRKHTYNHKILLKTGALRNDILVRGVTPNRFNVGTMNIVYSNIHNEGGKAMAWGKYEFTMKKRNFIGHSKALMFKHMVELQTMLNKV